MPALRGNQRLLALKLPLSNASMPGGLGLLLFIRRVPDRQREFRFSQFPGPAPRSTRGKLSGVWSTELRPSSSPLVYPSPAHRLAARAGQVLGIPREGCREKKRKTLTPPPGPPKPPGPRHHLLVTLLLRYRLRHQPGLTCKHVAIQVERGQVAAWRQNQGGRTRSALPVPETLRGPAVPTQ